MSRKVLDNGPLVELLRERLRSRRQELQYNLAALGRLTGVSGQCIGLIEAGKNLPSLPLLVALAAGLHVTTDWLLGRSEKKAA